MNSLLGIISRFETERIDLCIESWKRGSCAREFAAAWSESKVVTKNNGFELCPLDVVQNLEGSTNQNFLS